jgi:hypothetical protein
MRLAGHVARVGERRDAYRDLVGKYAGKRPLGVSKHRWEDNIKIYLKATGSITWNELNCLRIPTTGELLWTR